MRNIIYSILSIIAIYFLSGCAKDERLLYDSETASVYFYKNDIGLPRDSVYHSFALQPENVTVDTFYLNFRIIGTARDYDRTINVLVDESSTAVLGQHYDIGPTVIPANAYAAEAPVYLYRTPDLKNTTLHVYLTIGESEDFKLGYDHHVYSSIYSTLEYRFSFSDQLTKPAIWDSYWATHYGTYSETKIRFLNDVLAEAYYEMTGSELNWNVSIWLPHHLNFVVQRARLALYEYEQANGPLIDENEEQVTLN